jgi:trimeric autotransporter adhesin
MRRFLFFLTLVFTSTVFAQNITNTLASGGIFSILNGANTYFTVKQSTGLVGIGTNATDPKAQLEIGGTEGLLVRGTANSGTVRALGAGLRMHWYPRKGAFRAGMAETTWWDDDGTTLPKMALYSIAMGYMPRASATASSAIGAYNKATGDYSLSLGSYCNASGSHSIAIGTQVNASGIYSVALGAGADTNGKDGSFVLGDDTYFQTAYASADNQLTMRFSGGYRLWSSYPDSVAGVYMRHGQSGWSNYSDRNMKENFTDVDGEELLEKIRNIPVTEWNYKRTDPTMKYIGPMAQDFYAAFRLGGTDSLGINSISIDGVNIAGVKALEKRTRELRSALESVQQQNVMLMEENRKLQKQIAGLKDLSEEAAALRLLKAEMLEQLNVLKTKNKIEVSAK